MKQNDVISDPRVKLFAGILLLLAAAFVLQAFHGPGPAGALRINEANRAADRGELERAAELWEEVVAERSESVETCVHAGRSLVAAGRPLAGLIYLQRATELEPGRGHLRYELAKALAAAGLIEDARAMLEEVLRERPQHADALSLLAALAASEGDLDSTVRWFVRAQAARPSDPERFRRDARFDPVRNDPRFLTAVRSARLPALFVEARLR